MMKIRPLILIDSYEVGGAGKVILQFLANGGLDSCQPCVAGFWRGPRRRWAFREAVEAVGVEFVTLEQRHPFDPAAIGAALKVMRERGIDLIETHGYKAHVVGLALRQLTGTPWVAYVHGWTSENLKVQGYNLIEKTVVRFADQIIPVSHSLASRLHLGRRGRQKLSVIPNAADPLDLAGKGVDERERYGIAKDETLVGVIGRLSPEKGHRHFVEAFASVVGGGGKVKAIFVGEGQERGSLERLIARLGLQDSIILAGFQQEVASFYRACDIIGIPSLSEGMPNAALEAMLFAKPIIAFAVGGIPEVVVDNRTGCLVEPGNTEAFAATLAEMIADAETRAEFGEAGKRRAYLEFCPKKRAKRIVELHQQLLRSARKSHYQGDQWPTRTSAR